MRPNFTNEQKLEVINDYLSEKISKMGIRKKYKIGLKYFKKILREAKIENKTRPIDYNTRKYTLDFLFFRDINTEEKAYLLGLLASDGHITHKGNIHKIKISLIDLELIEKFKIAIGANNKIYSFKKKETHQIQYALTISSVEMIHDLEKYGLSGNKSSKTHIPKEVPYNLIKHFIRGYFDGDGSIYIDKKRCNFPTVTITSSSLGMLQQIDKYLKENNLVRLEKNLIEADNRGNCWYIRTNKIEEINNFLNHIYKDSKIYMKRKMDLYLQILERPFRPKGKNVKNKYFGVYKITKNNNVRYSSMIQHNKQIYRIGIFKSEIEAVLAYNEKVKELGLPDWRLNKIEPDPIT